MMDINNVKVYDMEESLKAAGYPMSIDIIKSKTPKKINELGSVKTGTGHDNFLKGIRVSFDVHYSQYWSMQAQRYTFLDIVSSQSKMHRILTMDIKEHCNNWVTNAAIENLNRQIEAYNKNGMHQNFMRVISNVPMGLELTMRVSTNYLQLKTIYQQRKNHKLEDWSIFCNWILTLDKFQELCLNK